MAVKFDYFPPAMAEIDINTVLATNGLAGVLFFGAWSWLSVGLKEKIKHDYEQKLDDHKKETQAELANLNANLQRLNAEQNVRFSRVFEKTAETIATIYKMLFKLKRCVWTSTEGMKHTIDELYEYYGANKIYLPKKTSAKINSLFLPLEDFEGTAKFNAPGDSVLHLAELIDGVLDEIEDDFQEILGFPREKNSLAQKP